MNQIPASMSIKPVRIQRKRAKGWRMPANTVYVGRGSAFGNPFKVGIDGTVEECLDKYQAQLFPYSKHTGNLDDFLVSECNMNWIISELRGKNLACWCGIDKPCHADFLLRIANGSVAYAG